MKKPSLGLILFLFITFSATALRARDTGPEDFAFRAEIPGKLAGNTIYRLRLPPEVLGKCALNYRDIRIFDSSSREVPYVIIPNEYPAEKRIVYNLKVAGYEPVNNVSEFNGTAWVLTLQTHKTAQPLSRLELDIPERDFLKRYILEKINTNETRERIADGSLYDFSSQVNLRKTWIEFPRTQAQTFRLAIFDSPEDDSKTVNIKTQSQASGFSITLSRGKKLRINGIKAITTTDEKTVRNFDSFKFSRITSILDSKKRTQIVLEAALPAQKITFETTDPYFLRDATVSVSDDGRKWQEIARGKLYRFLPAAEGAEAEKLLAENPSDTLTVSSVNKRFYQFLIDNRDNPPLNIKSISFEWVSLNLFFSPAEDNGEYTLYFGSPGLDLPSYDLGRMIGPGNWRTLPSREVRLSPPEMNKDISFFKLMSGKEKYLLYAIVGFMVAAMGLWLTRILSSTPKK